MIDIEAKVVETLQFDADRPVKVDGLHDGAIGRARSIRRRRRALGTTVAVGLVAAATAGVVVAPRMANGPAGNLARPVVEADETASAPVSTAGPTTLPEAAGVPAAGQRPASVGSDPSLLHFDVDLAAVKDSKSSYWTSGERFEKVVIGTKARDWAIEAVLAQDPRLLDMMTAAGWSRQRVDGTFDQKRPDLEESTTVDGRPATLRKFSDNPLPDEKYDDTYLWRLTWQPVDGLWAAVQVHKADKSLAFATARALRLDHTQRCVLPVRFTDVVAGAKWVGCDVQVRRRALGGGRGVFVSGGVTIAQPDGHRVNVWFEDGKTKDHPHDAGWFQPNMTIAGHPAMWMIKGERGLAVEGLGALDAGVWPARRPQDNNLLTKEESVRLIEGVRVAGNLGTPQAWPQRAIG